MVPFGYLNLKLVLGSSLKSGESKALPTQIGKDLSEMIRLCPWTACSIPRAFQRWKLKWRGWFQPNWFLPPHLGGYGVLPRDAPDSWYITREQRIMANMMLDDPTSQIIRHSGCPRKIAQDIVRLFDGRITYGVSEVDELEESWRERLTYIENACGANLTEVEDKVFYSKVPKKFGVKPISDRRIMEHWTMSVQNRIGVPCPPLNYLF